MPETKILSDLKMADIKKELEVRGLDTPAEPVEVSSVDKDKTDGVENHLSVSAENKDVSNSEVNIEIEVEEIAILEIESEEYVVGETIVPKDELIEQTCSDLKEVQESEDVLTTDISETETDDDPDQDALRLTIGDEYAVGEYDFFTKEYQNDEEENSEVEKESAVAEGCKSSVPDSVDGGKAVDDEEKVHADSKPESVISDAADVKIETFSDSFNLSSSFTNDNKIPEEVSPDMETKEGFIMVPNELWSKCTASEIKSAFQKYGKIVDVKVISNNKTTGARRFAHVEMSSEDVNFIAQRASVDGSPAKKGGKSRHHSNGGVEEQKNGHTRTKISEECKASSITSTSTVTSSKQKDVDKKQKPSVDKKSESSISKDCSDKDKGKEKSQDHSGKGEKDKHMSSTKDSKKSDADKSKSGTGGTANTNSNKSGTEAQGGRKMELRKDKGRFFDSRRTFNPRRHSGFQRGNDAPRFEPPIHSRYNLRTSTPFHHRERLRRSPQVNLSRPCLAFDKFLERRAKKSRLRENERKVSEPERRRKEEEEKQRLIEKRNKEEFLSLERERKQLQEERKKVEKDKRELMRIQKERQRIERENIEKEREELRQAQLKIEEHRLLLKRPYAESKKYLDRKEPLIKHSIRVDDTGRPDTFMPTHEARLEPRAELNRHDRDHRLDRHDRDPRLERHDRDPSLDRDNLLQQSPREFLAPPGRTSVRLGDRDEDWGDRRDISRNPRKKLKQAMNSDDRRASRIRSRAPGDLAADYAGSYRPSAYAPMKISDQNDKGDYGRKSLERKIPPSSSARGDSLMPSHFAADRVWSSNITSEPSWNTPYEFSGRSGHHSSDRWSNPSANVSGLSGSRASGNILPPVGGRPTASNSMYTAVPGSSSAAAYGRSGRFSHFYSRDEFTYGRFRRF